MAGQVVLGETVLKSAIAMEAAAPTVETLVAGHSVMVFRIAYSILRNHHDAEDSAQDCFLRVWKHRDRLHELNNAKTWEARMAWTRALEKRRATRVLVSLSYEKWGMELMQPISDSAPAADEH